MPELPDITIYLEALESRVVGQRVQAVRLISPFLLRTVAPPIETLENRTVEGLRRLGKRIVFECGDDLFVVFHLMIAGRFRWIEKPGSRAGGKTMLATFDFPNGTLVLTEAGSKKRSALHLVQGAVALAENDPGGLEVLAAGADGFAAALRREDHTLKRALTDPHLFSGIGNAYSDEILHAARLSPFKRTTMLSDQDVATLHQATTGTLQHWIETLRKQFKSRFPGPGDITAFRPGFAVHGKFGAPCPVCQCPVQRVRYAENETNYCPGCQTGGKVLADRSLSRLLKKDWPRVVEDL